MQTKLLRPLHEHYAAMAGAADGGGDAQAMSRGESVYVNWKAAQKSRIQFIQFSRLALPYSPNKPSFPVRSCT